VIHERVFILKRYFNPKMGGKTLLVILLVFSLFFVSVAADCESNSDCGSGQVCDVDSGSCLVAQGYPCPGGLAYQCAQGLGCAFDKTKNTQVCWPNGCGPVDGYCDPTRDSCSCEPACCQAPVVQNECDFSGARCQGDQVVRCDDADHDGVKEVRVVDDCQSRGMECEGGSCVSQQCEDNGCSKSGYLCKGDTLYSCQRDSSGCLYPSYVDDCNDYEICNDMTGRCESNKRECPYDCCSGDDEYLHKDCSDSSLRCSFHTCVSEKKPCPKAYECCVSGEFEAKVCSNGETCKNNKCVTKIKDCPFDCCVNNPDFKVKTCDTGKECVGYKCQKLCKDECEFDGVQCYNGDVYECRQVENCKKLVLIKECEGMTCEEATCKETCVQNDYQSCYQGKVYSFDSCGKPGSLVKECPDGCLDGKCLERG